MPVFQTGFARNSQQQPPTSLFAETGVRAMMFADAEDIETGLVGQLDLGHQFAHALAAAAPGLRSTNV